MKHILLFLFFPMIGGLRADGLKSLLPAVEVNLRQEVLEAWFPACVDEAHGGFHQNFAEDWTLQAEDERSSGLPGAADLDCGAGGGGFS